MLIKIAWRNIWRNKKRSMIILVAVGLGLWAGIFLMGFYNGMIEDRIKSAISEELSHVQLHHPEFRKEFEIKYYLQNGPEKLKKIRSDKDVVVATGRVISTGMIASAYGSIGITINGVMPDLEQKITNLKGKLTSGEYLDQGKNNEIILSERVCKKLKVQLRKKIVLTYQDIEGNLVSMAFRIVGIYRTVNGPYDDRNIFVNIHSIDSLSGIPGQFNEISVLLRSNELLTSFQNRLKIDHPDSEVKNWMELQPELGLTVSVGDQMTYIFMGIILLALAFGIINTMMMAVLEREKELGMMIALGMNKLKVFIMILLETLFLIIAGCPGGILLGLATVYITSQTGIDLSKYTEAYSSFGYKSTIYPSFKLSQFNIIMFLVVVTAILSSLLPARRALKLNPAETLKK